MRLLVALLVVIQASASVPAQSEAFRALYNLDYDRAVALFEAHAKKAPNDPEGLNHLAQALLYRALYKGDALNSDTFSMGNAFLRRPEVTMPAADEKRFIEVLNLSMRLTEARLHQDKHDRGALYARGVAYAHRAQFFLLVKKANLDALRDGTRSRRAHNELLDLESTQVDAKLIPGMHEYVVGNLPGWVKAFIFLAGFAGDKWKGIGYLEDAARYGQKTGVEARVLLSLIYSREKQPARGIPLVRELVEAFPRNYLYRSEIALLLASAGRRTEALAAVAEIERLKRENNPNLSLMPKEKIVRLRRSVEARAGL